MQVISLFSGIGGFELAADWIGWENIVSCEINPFGRKILEYYWPDSYHHDDIHTLTYEKINDELTKRKGEQWRSDDIILVGGFPCQPYSLAGKRKGKEDDRHLWPEMLRTIREIQPKWVLGENVFGIINWNGGLVFDEVQSDLEAEGYEVQSYVLPAVSQNAPHRRDRVWFVAYRKDLGCKRPSGINKRSEHKPNNREKIWTESTSNGEKSNATDTNGNPEGPSGKSRKIKKNRDNKNVRQNQWGSKTKLNNRFSSFSPNATNTDSRRQSGEEYRKEESGWASKKSFPGNWENFPTQSPICSGDDGIPDKLDGITFPKWRNESIKAFGNAVVPQVVYQIFKAIQEYEDTVNK